MHWQVHKTSRKSQGLFLVPVGLGGATRLVLHQTRVDFCKVGFVLSETRAALSLEVNVSWSGVPAWCLWIRKFSTLYSKSVKCPWLGWASRIISFLVGRVFPSSALRKPSHLSAHQYFAEDAQGPQTWMLGRALKCCDGRHSLFFVRGPGLPALLLHLFLLEILSRYQTSAIVELTCLLLSWGSPAWPPDAEYCDFCFSSFLSCFRWEGKYEPFTSCWPGVKLYKDNPKGPPQPS